MSSGHSRGIVVSHHFSDPGVQDHTPVVVKTRETKSNDFPHSNDPVSEKHTDNGEIIIFNDVVINYNNNSKRCTSSVPISPICLLGHSYQSQDYRSIRLLRCLYCSDSGCLHGSCWIFPIQLFPIWCVILCGDCSSCCLPTHPSEQRE